LPSVRLAPQAQRIVLGDRLDRHGLAVASAIG
jgi:hypothetical protein